MTYRDNSFDLVRLLGALMVLWGHSFALAGSIYVPALFSSSVHTVGVKMFFVISGYLISQSWLRDPNIIRYFQRRCLRIFPALIFCVVLTVFVFGPIFSSRSVSAYFSDPATFRYLKNSALYISYYLPGLFEGNPSSSINGSLWTLPVEMAAYIACPIVLFIRKQLVLKVAICLVLALSIYVDRIALSLPAEDHVVFYATNLVYANSLLVYFWIGCFIALFRLDRFLNLQVALLLVIVFLSVPNFYGVKPYLAYLVISYLTLALGTTKLAPGFSWVRRGDISYGLYLWAYPVQQVVIFNKLGSGTPLSVFLWATAITAVFATVSWVYIEKPALKFKPRSRATPEAADAVTETLPS